MNDKEEQALESDKEFGFTILNGGDKEVLLESDNGVIRCLDDCRTWWSCCNTTCNCFFYG